LSPKELFAPLLVRGHDQERVSLEERERVCLCV